MLEPNEQCLLLDRRLASSHWMQMRPGIVEPCWGCICTGDTILHIYTYGPGVSGRSCPGVTAPTTPAPALCGQPHPPAFSRARPVQSSSASGPIRPDPSKFPAPPAPPLSPTVCIAAGGSPLHVSPPRTDYQRVESLGATRLFACASPSTPSALRNAAARSLTHMLSSASMPPSHPLGRLAPPISTPSAADASSLSPHSFF
ncbi:hypothetical protein B0H13DRAFT_2361641 [Mycena leptocephala]|nr:hypothetical protein B0H13DRAFT_2361641 [Mycena leptocephala]